MIDNGFHFCMNCGSKLDSTDKFCGNCGVKVGEVRRRKIEINKPLFTSYKSQIDELKAEYEDKKDNAKDLIEKFFVKSQMKQYTNFSHYLSKTDDLFYEQWDIANKIIELASSESLVLKKELDNKIIILKSIITKLNDLIDELIINISSNDDNDEEIESVIDDMENLINSVKKYK